MYTVQQMRPCFHLSFLIFPWCLLLHLHHPSLQVLCPRLRLPHDHGCNGDVVDLVLGDDVELVGEAAEEFRGRPEGDCDPAAHSHGNLDSWRRTGPI